MSTQTASSTASPKCAVCNEPPLENQQHLKCGGCQATQYCGKACQKEDWYTHKLVCDQFKTLATANPCPSVQHKLAIFLPVDEDKPKLLWIKCSGQYAGDFETAQYHEHLGTLAHLTDEMRISLNLQRKAPSVRRYALDHMVVMVIRDECELDGSKPNQCVASMMKGTHRHHWKGPMIVLGKAGLEPDPLFYQDVVAPDLRVVADYLRAYGLDKPTREATMISDPKMVAEYLKRMFSNAGRS